MFLYSTRVSVIIYSKAKQTIHQNLYLYFLSQIPVWGLETIWRNNQVVGYLRRGEYGYSLGCSIGMGLVIKYNP